MRAHRIRLVDTDKFWAGCESMCEQWNHSTDGEGKEK